MSQALQYIQHCTSSRGNRLFLRKVLGYFNNPHLKCSVIHVAGTNGKGSICAMLSSILTEAGYQTGCFTSPHLQHYNERIAINGALIDDADFEAVIGQIKEAANDLATNDDDRLSFFELMTIAAFLHFYNKKVDYIVLEVGIGGRLDATNVVEHPVLSVIMAIGYDHMDVLGNTLEAIAFEKAGIIKQNAPVVLYTPQKEVYKVVSDVAHEKDAPLYCFNKLDTQIISCDLAETTFSVESDYFCYNKVRITLLGAHQIANACHALLCVEVLRRHGVCLPEDAVLSGLAKTFWPGRMEIISRDPFVILDGAHNGHSAAVFSETVEQYFSNKNIIIIAGIVEDKNYKKMLPHFARHASILILTKPVQNKGLSPGVLASAIKGFSGKLILEDNCIKAFETAIDLAENNDMIAVTGSLYLVSDIRNYYRRKRL